MIVMPGNTDVSRLGFKDEFNFRAELRGPFATFFDLRVRRRA
jgi:hypothetical protein